MVEIAHSFADGAGYERFMGPWSRAAGALFLDWIGPPARARWLEVGCGTGVFTELVLDTCSPAAVLAIDPAGAQIACACARPFARRATFLAADAQALPFPDSMFDVVASALVINFIPDRPRAVSEMRRVARARGVIAGYVWDFAAERSPSWPVRAAMRRIGTDVPEAPGTDQSRLTALRALFEASGLEGIVTRCFDVTVRYPDFDGFWQAQTPSYSPTTKTIDAMGPGDRARLREAVKAALSMGADGSVAYSARANAIKARPLR